MSRVDVVGEAGDVCVLMWLVVYSRSVVYTSELESALENGNEKRNVSRLLQLRVSDWPEQGYGIVTCYRQYLRVRRPAIFTRAWPTATLRAPQRRDSCFAASRDNRSIIHTRNECEHACWTMAPPPLLISFFNFATVQECRNKI